ncbi:UDP-N-acetylmuramoyl-L-alanine--D-glutamate ligase [Candidatus Nomurabacteria bacterium]|nr:UDP-N-acetylmuramoyl-L-alanine--D-glutamate ligase [Candidatus Nomurabacteria bacterium]
MTDYRAFFKDKKVTVVGLGLLGKRLGDIAFLAECGAKVLVTDLKPSTELRPSLQKLRKYRSIKYVLGEHRFEDFQDKDFILKGQGVALDSPYIKHARKKGIPIEMDESLFIKLVPGVKIIGVTGTRGKSTTTILIYEILKAAYKNPLTSLRTKKPVVFLGGNIKGTAALPLLKKVKDGDIVVFELSSWQLQGFGEAKISPYISVFTNFMPDHMNYYKNNLKKYFTDKSYIYKFQKNRDTLVLGPNMKSLIKNAKGRIINASFKNIPKSWKINLPGKHNLANIACAIEVARVLQIKEETIKKVVEKFEAIEGRLELVKTIRGIKIYNDTNSCTPEATSVALQALSEKKRNIILILGGSDKNLDFKNLFQDIEKYVKALVLIPGNGTDRIMQNYSIIKNVHIYKEGNFKEVVLKAYSLTKKGDIMLFSPAFTSFGMFNNEYDRGDKFMEIVKKLK